MAIQITVRFLESLIRLAQAHASLMHRDIVQLDDAVAIIMLMESSVASLTQNNYNSISDDPTSDFPDDDYADIDFVLNKVKILENYNMQQFITTEEYRIVHNEQSKVATDPLMDSWDNYHNSSQTFQEVDHYGRLTPRSTPSPSKKRPNSAGFQQVEDGFDCQDEFNNSRPPTYSAD